MRLATLFLAFLGLTGCASTPYFYTWGGKGEIHWHDNTKWCLPGKLKRALRRTAHHYGDVHVHSTFRSPWYNRRIGGARKSLHKKCKAVDFSVKGASMRDVYAFVQRQPGVGGRKLYPGGRHIHIDTGPRRTW